MKKREKQIEDEIEREKVIKARKLEMELLHTKAILSQ